MEPERRERGSGALSGLEALEALERRRRPAPPEAPAPRPDTYDPLWAGTAATTPDPRDTRRRRDAAAASARSAAPTRSAAPAAPVTYAPQPVQAPPDEPPIVQSWGRVGIRQRIRRRGAFVGLLLPLVLGVTSWWLLHGSTGAGRGIGGFALALLAAPLLPAFGAPLRSGSGAVTGAIVASAALWFVLGAYAAARSTRRADTGWGRFWVEFLWLSSCVWLGAVLAEVAANLVLGRVLV